MTELQRVEMDLRDLRHRWRLSKMIQCRSLGVDAQVVKACNVVMDMLEREINGLELVKSRLPKPPAQPRYAECDLEQNYSVAECCRELRTSRYHVKELIRTGRLRSYGKCVPASALKQFKEKRGIC